MNYAREKSAKSQTFKRQPQVLVQTVVLGRTQPQVKSTLMIYWKKNKILVTNQNVEKPTSSSFNTRMGMKTPSSKRPFQISSPFNDVEIIKQLESFTGDNDKMLDYDKSFLDKTPANKLLHQDGD